MVGESEVAVVQVDVGRVVPLAGVLDTRLPGSGRKAQRRSWRAD
jgi:hypothetical protein